MGCALHAMPARRLPECWTSRVIIPWSYATSTAVLQVKPGGVGMLGAVIIRQVLKTRAGGML